MKTDSDFDEDDADQNAMDIDAAPLLPATGNSSFYLVHNYRLITIKPTRPDFECQNLQLAYESRLSFANPLVASSPLGSSPRTERRQYRH